MFSTMQTNMAILLTFRDDFNSFLTDRFDSSKFGDIFSEYNKFYSGIGFGMPDTLFDIFYSSFVRTEPKEDPGIDVNWGMFTEMLSRDYLINSDADNLQIDQSTKKIDISEEFSKAMRLEVLPSKEKYLTDIFTELVKISWDVYIHFMPVEKYGLPTKNILEWLINCAFNILDGTKIDEPDKPYPYVMKTYDAYGILDKYEIGYLRNLLQKNGVNVKEQMSQDGFDTFRNKLRKILKLDPLCQIVSSPSITAGKFRTPEINAQILDGFGNAHNDVSETTPYNLYETQLNYALIYCDYFFNHKTTFDEIDKNINDKIEEALELKEKGLDLSEHQELLLAKNHEIKSLRKYAKKYITEMLKNAGCEIDFASSEMPNELKRGPGRPEDK